MDPKKITTLKFSSIAELVSFALENPAPMHSAKNANLLRSLAGESRERDRTWYGLDTAAQCLQAVNEGYERGAQKVDALLDHLAPHLPRAIDISRKRMRGAQGDSLDVHAVLRGDLSRCWETVGRAFRPARSIVRIAVDLVGSSGTHSDALQWRGVAALALAQALQKAHYSVEIVAGFCVNGAAGRAAGETEGHTHHYSVMVPVKARGEIGNSLKLAGTVCIAGFGRYVALSAITRQADAERRTMNDFCGFPAALTERLPADSRIAQFVVPAGVLSEKAAIDWVKETIKVLQSVSLAKE